MDYNNNPRMTPPPYYGQQANSVTRVNGILKRVYLRMFIGMLVTAFSSLFMLASGLSVAFISTPIAFWGCAIAMFALAIMIPVRMAKMSTGTLLLLFFAYCALMGVWLTPIFFVYQLGSIAYTFFITAGVFGAMSVYGYFTKTNLAKMGSFLMMALFGLIIVMIVNIFAKSSSLEWIISAAGVLIFIGLTAWDTQTVKQLANSPELDGVTLNKLATMGAFNLYLDFINMFLFLLRIFGDRD